MNYFWFDHKAKNGHPENAIFKDLVKLFDAKMVASAPAVGSPCVCFVHPSTAASNTSADWEVIANVAKQQFVAFLSFGGDPTSKKGVDDGVATLQRDALRRGVLNLKEDEGRKREFCDSVLDGKPKWDLLAPKAPEMEHVIAYYLIAISGSTINEKLKNIAHNEYLNVAELLGLSRIEESIDEVDIPSLLETWSKM